MLRFPIPLAVRALKLNKLASFLLPLLVLHSVAGCSGTPSEETPTASDTPAVTSPPDQTPTPTPRPPEPTPTPESITPTPVPNHAPELTVVAPLDNAVYNAGSTVSFSLLVSDDQPVSTAMVAVYSSLDGELYAGAPTSGGVVTFAKVLTPGSHVLTLTATDAAGLVDAVLLNLKINQAPLVTLKQPADGTLIGYGEVVTVVAQADDADNAPETLSAVVLSSLDGAVASLKVDEFGFVRATLSDLSPGAQTLEVRVTDPSGARGSDSVDITVSACAGTDSDGDGYGANTSCPQVDCDDNDGSIHPGAVEECDGKDQDCNGVIDDGLSITWYKDNDGDSYGSTSSGTTRSCLQPSGYSSNASDCNDSDAGVHPGATEVCNSKDDNCDGKTDDGQSITYYLDQDKDGYGQTGSTIQSCSPPSGYSAQSGDCNDTNAAVNPGKAEVCNSIDDNCDGGIDTGLTATFYRDADGDGYGTASSTLQACSQPAGYSSVNTDCDDTRADTNPAAAEVCNGRDDNCDGKSDDGTSITYYRDADGDGYGVSSSTSQACAQPSGYASRAGDCDDNNAAVNPGASETCNGRDDNCSGQSDEGVLLTFYKDADGDTFGSSTSGTSQACSAPPGYTSDKSDCNDSDATIHPDATERCNGKDDNCDGDVDGEFDQDHDGITTCATQPDCNDTQPTTFPGATEVCDNADNDCDSQIDEGFDQDKDGFTTCGTPADCNDVQAGINPNATELCDSLDNDCDGVVDDGVGNTYYADVDQDGYGNPNSVKVSCTPPSGYVTNNTDCDDSKASVKPTATEVCNNVDDDCDGAKDEGLTTTWYPDADLDGYGNSSQSVQACTQPSGTVSVGGDCNDTTASIKPGATETCNGIDDNCDGKTDNLPGAGTFYKDGDNDGYGNASSGTTTGCTKPSGYALLSTDCNDTNSNVYPGATDNTADGLDADCDGRDARPYSTTTLGLADAPTRINGALASDNLEQVAFVGDTNGDGFDDLLVGAPNNDAGGTNAGAAYLFLGPVVGTLDATTAAAEFRGELASDGAGTAVSAAGDVNGDGYDDMLIGAPYADNGASANVGIAYLIYGPVSGVIRLSNADARFVGPAAGAQVGLSVSGGDFNGDGYSDIAIGAYNATLLSRSGNGGVYLIRGSTSLSGTVNLSASTSFYAGASAGNNLGTAVSLSGDYNGDGKRDLVMGAPYFNSTSTGAVYVVNGSTTVPNSVDLNTGSAYSVRFVGESNYLYLGDAIESAGDVDGDGLDDLLIGAQYYTGTSTYQGAVYLVKGGVNSGGVTLNLTTALLRLTGVYVYDYLGNAVAGAGDVNGDGFDDVVVGSYGYDTNTSQAYYIGAAYLFLGARTPLWTLATADLRVIGESDYSYLGGGLAGGGDLNADGLSDIATGGNSADSNSRSNNGSAVVFSGSPVLNTRSSAARPRYVGEANTDGLGRTLAAAGDVNGDGLQDMIFGSDAYDVDTKSNAGAAWLVLGSNSITAGDKSIGNATARFQGEAASDGAGAAVASAGDVNGDGYDDLLIGAPFNDAAATDAGAVYLVLGPVTGTVNLSAARAKFTGEKANDNAGNALAPLGDINKDGFDDFAIGASKYDDGAKKDVGAVYVVYGSASLTGTSSLSTATAILVGELNFDYAGSSVIGPGDLNGDGTPDLVLGAREFDGTGIDSGAAYIFFGPVTGLKNIAANNGRIRGDAAYDYAGTALAATGDTNGDGLMDFAIGAPGYDGSGRSASGAIAIVLGATSYTSVTTLGSARARIYGETAGDAFGSAVSGGDVNGDGLGDLLVGAPTFDYMGTDVGAAYLFLSPKTGYNGTYSTAAAITWNRFVGNEATDFSGVGVAILGDVSGDRYGDFLVGVSGYDSASLTNSGSALLVRWRDF